MARFHSSSLALSNLLIGLARGYRKEKNRIERRWAKDPRKARDMVIKMEYEFEEYLADSLDGIFDTWLIKDLACKIMRGCEDFKDPRNKTE